MAKRTQEDRDSLAGKMLGHYRLERIMASGGMARIYRAMDTNLDRVVAVKILMRELIEQDDTLTERFEREAKSVAALEHDHIVRVYDYRRQKDLYYIVMNYIEGKDLADEIDDLRRKGQLMNVDRALRILGQVASALDFAHAAGIIHRDVKPSNILLDKNDKAILTDFGLVLRQAVDQTLGTAFGTPRYISPEQALASETSVPQSDIYSLAVIVYEILTGDMLFRADTPMQIALSHISEPPPRPRSVNPDIPEAAEREILKALDKNPLNRHRSATEFINALKAAYAVARPDKYARPPAEVRTPVFNEAQEMKKALLASWDDPLPVASPADPKTIPDRMLDKPTDKRDKRDKRKTEETAVPGSIQLNPDGSSSTRRRLPVPVIAGGAVAALALIGVLAFMVINGRGSNGAAIIQAPTSTEIKSAAPTPRPTVALVSGGVPLQISYNGTTLVIRNPNDADVDFSAFSLAKPGDGPGIAGTQIRQSRIPAGQCVSLVQSGRDFDERDWDCRGINHAKVDVPGTDLFWRTALPDQFEVRKDGEVIATCDTIRRDGSSGCEIRLPG